MKHLKMLGLAALAAMALMAFAGAGSASATVLCKTTLTSGCAGEWDRPAGTEIHATLRKGTKAVLNASGIRDECSESTVSGTTTNTGSSNDTVDGIIHWEPGVTEDLTWGGCTAEVTKTVKGGLMEIHWISGTDNGTVTVKQAEVTVKTAGISCFYSATEEGIDLGTLVGSHTEPTISVNTKVLITGGFLCQGTATWTAEYVVTSPTPLFVSTN